MLHLAKTDVDDRLSDLHFQLSNADRRRIVEELQKENLKLNEVSKKLDMTATEAFRQLQRLSESGLLEKIPDGKYRSTPYARLILESSATLDFVSKYREYFMEHDTSLMPLEFRIRLGELSETHLMTEAVPSLDGASEVFKRAEKRIDVMAEQRLGAHDAIINQRLDEGVRVRLLVQESLLPTVREGRVQPIKDQVEIRSVPKICSIVVLTEKHAGIGLPKMDGKMDYAIFAGADPESLKWAGDLFEDQWEKARPWHPQ